MPQPSDESTFQIYRYHANLETSRVVVEFRVKNLETGAFEPPIGYARHSLPLNQEIVDALRADVSALLARDLAELPPPLLHTHAVTSELHQLRELRHTKSEVMREVHEAHARSREHHAAADRAVAARIASEEAVGELAKERDRLERVVLALRAEASGHSKGKQG